MTTQNLLHFMKKAAEKASIGLIRDFGELEKLGVTKKGPKSFVTSADRKSESVLMRHLESIVPSASFLCEESGFTDGQGGECCWIIDPIDGTTNFMRGIPVFAINIAFMENRNVSAALTYEPIRGVSFSATVGNGAFSDRQRLRGSNREDIEDALCALHVSVDEEKFLLEKGAIIRRTGSVALDLAYFASGRYDIVIARNVGLWDISAGILLIRESGGFSKVSKNENGSYNIVAASSKKIIDLLV